MVPISRLHRKYLRFLFNGELFEFTCMCFGLNVAPFGFTKLMKPIVTFLRSHGFMSVVYLDDFLLIGKTKDECLKNVSATISLLEYLGLIINYEKSVLIPSTTLEYLDFIFNSNSMSIELLFSKQQRICALCSSFYDKKSCTIREFAQLIGTLVSVCPATRYGDILIRICLCHLL